MHSDLRTYHVHPRNQPPLAIPIQECLRWRAQRRDERRKVRRVIEIPVLVASREEVFRQEEIPGLSFSALRNHTDQEPDN